MENTNANEFLVLNLFIKLRKAGLPLILNDYEDALEILARPTAIDFDLNSLTSVIQLCHCLWVKSVEQDRIFETCVEEIKLPSSRKAKKEVEMADELSSSVSTQTSTNSSTDIDIQPKPLQSERVAEPADKLVVKAIATRIAKPQDRYTRIKVDKFYLPASHLQMQQAWQTLQALQFARTRTEIDIAATLRDVEKKGTLFDVILKSPQQPSLELLLLIDRQGSMVPFHGLARQIVETALRGTHVGKIDCYYFENYPDGELYCDPECWNSKRMGSVLSRLHPERTVVLIFSDAGAARGKFSLERLEATELFLNKLKSSCRNIVWVNPLPKRRWSKTTAEFIARLTHLVTMFECDRQGWEKAIDRLQGEHLSSPKLRSSPLTKKEKSFARPLVQASGSSSLSSEPRRKIP